MSKYKLLLHLRSILFGAFDVMDPPIDSLENRRNAFECASNLSRKVEDLIRELGEGQSYMGSRIKVFETLEALIEEHKETDSDSDISTL